jgi:polysaccharide pyruvyl transferase WcaK-like protein
MKTLHTYCLNYNVGDYALGFGVKNVLRKYLKPDLIAQTNLQGREFNEYYINEVVNKRFDLLVVGGGGIIHGSHWPQGWFWLIEPDLISKIKVPFFVYGAGYNYFEDEEGIPQRGIDHLHETVRHAAYFSVRNDGSHKRLLDATGVEANVIPDPGFHVPLGRDWGPQVDGDFVVLQLADDKSKHRFGDSEQKQKFVEQIKDVVRGLAKRYRVIVIPHVHEDVGVSSEVVQGIENAELLDFSSYAFDQCESVMKYYRDAKFVVAMRGHGQIIPIGFGTPAITFSTHAKIKGMMDTLGLSEFHVPMDDDFPSKIANAISNLELNLEETRTALEKTGSELLAQTESQFELIKKRLVV